MRFYCHSFVIVLLGAFTNTERHPYTHTNTQTHPFCFTHVSVCPPCSPTSPYLYRFKACRENSIYSVNIAGIFLLKGIFNASHCRIVW